ncbi:hypothetical protein V6N11_051344 [Hibiscus sabdariffa]|uniref:Uncharacterized protein n=2 Tax=Hibiscus sabdariffa TaxID=183260 RepID=A0ABR2BIL8_9ROSI
MGQQFLAIHTWTLKYHLKAYKAPLVDQKEMKLQRRTRRTLEITVSGQTTEQLFEEWSHTQGRAPRGKWKSDNINSKESTNI